MKLSLLSRRQAAAAALTASLLLSGCAAEDPLAEKVNAGTNSYVAGDGSVAEYAEGIRGETVRLSGQLFDGTTVSNDDWAGKVTVLNVWYAACAPCRVEAPDLSALHAEFEPQGVQFYGINTRDEAATASAFERTFGIEYPSFKDKNGQILLALTDYVPPQAVPTTLVLDKDGRVAARILGIAEKSTLTAIIEDALAAPGTEKP
ncbi:TlpA family protein disulfide reductase [Arthrobacter crystallopoietes]|uniref:Thiol-disulfide isomerase or thioredoxin n=1 Tax=Crystallibacter crystallopoietes TaxID=37928 RepID=A0A1H1FVM9_9MICC|nr:TlpA disulfide reductase family protein [Arthrobacter crystallopoietes]AUI52891.1 thiol-disulfide isomerase [Arthrobacter crystallopoietes]SDR05037.1 Thiol-disulfide isomerase or thioredoxin [Arthrobacter crystallopoietes]